MALCGLSGTVDWIKGRKRSSSLQKRNQEERRRLRIKLPKLEWSDDVLDPARVRIAPGCAPGRGIMHVLTRQPDSTYSSQRALAQVTSRPPPLLP